MKPQLLTFVIGAACGALGMFLANRDDPGTRPAPAASAAKSIHPDREQQKIAALEKKIADLEAQVKPSLVAASREAADPDEAKKSPTVKIFGSGASQIDLGQMKEHIERAEKERSAKRVASRLATLTKALDLTEDQAAQVRELLEKKEANLRDGLSEIMGIASGTIAGGNAEDLVSSLVTDADEVPGPDAFDFESELLALLDDDQTAAYQTYVEAQNENYIEASANRQLAQLQTTIPDLSKEQKDQAFNEYARLAREEVETNGVPEDGNGFDIPRMMRQREAEQDAIAGILTPEQREAYESARPSRVMTIRRGESPAIISSEINIAPTEIIIEDD